MSAFQFFSNALAKFTIQMGNIGSGVVNFILLPRFRNTRSLWRRLMADLLGVCIYCFKKFKSKTALPKTNFFLYYCFIIRKYIEESSIKIEYKTYRYTFGYLPLRVFLDVRGVEISVYT